MPMEYGSSPGAPAPTGSSAPPRNESPTALVPLEAFGGKDVEVGSVCSFRVVRVYNDQAEVEYVPHDEEEGQESAEPAEPGYQQAPQEGEMTGLLE